MLHYFFLKKNGNLSEILMENDVVSNLLMNQCFFFLVLAIIYNKLSCENLFSFLQVFLEYADVDGSTKARSGLNGRKFGGNQVIAVFYPENKFAQGDYEG